MLSTPPATTSAPSSALDRVGGARHGLETRAAESIHRLPRHLYRQAGEQQRHSGDVPVVLARLIGAAEDDVVDPAGGRRGPLDQGADGDRGEVVGPDVGQRAAGAPDRRAHGIEDERFGHSQVPVKGRIQAPTSS